MTTLTLVALAVFVYVVCGSVTSAIMVYRYAVERGRNGYQRLDDGDIISLAILSFLFWPIPVFIVLPMLAVSDAASAFYRRVVKRLVERGIATGGAEREAELQRQAEAEEADEYEAKLRADAEREAARLLDPDPDDPPCPPPPPRVTQESGVTVTDYTVTDKPEPDAPTDRAKLSLTDLYTMTSAHMDLADHTRLHDALSRGDYQLARAVCGAVLTRIESVAALEARRRQIAPSLDTSLLLGMTDAEWSIYAGAVETHAYGAQVSVLAIVSARIATHRSIARVVAAPPVLTQQSGYGYMRTDYTLTDKPEPRRLTQTEAYEWMTDWLSANRARIASGDVTVPMVPPPDVGAVYESTPDVCAHPPTHVRRARDVRDNLVRYYCLRCGATSLPIDEAPPTRCEHEPVLVVGEGMEYGAPEHYRCQRCGATWPERIGPGGPLTW